MTETNNNRDVARDVFWRFDEVINRGHIDYMRHARRLEDYYLGGGRQWLDEDRAALEAEGRPAHEVNTILPTVNAAAGYQIANRVDITFQAKGNRATEDSARTMSKVIKHALDNTKYRWRETQMFLDGLIQQRGYLDLRMDYEDSLAGELKIVDLDPMDVVPDPDAKGYDPDTWADVNVSRWLTEREIEGTYGQAAAKAVVEASVGYVDQDNFGTEYVDREGFGEIPPSYGQSKGWYYDGARRRRYRVIDRQSHEYALSLVAVWPTGDLRVVEHLPREKLAWLIDNGVAIKKQRVRRVRWEVCAPEVCFVNQLSPYEHFTIVPYFPYFRRGRTVGMIDNMVSPTDMLNKFVSQFSHIINTTANSGWQGEADSLANMTDEELTERGAETGLVLLRKPSKPELKKITPNPVPAGVEKMIEFAHNHLNIVSGVDPNLRDPQANEMSGVAIQSLQFAAQQKLAIALDNLSQSRHMVAERARSIVQRFMGDERVIRITKVDSYGVERRVPLALNVPMDDGTVMNDLTVGEYDITISERPAAITFDNSDFEQLKTMRVDMGIAIPDAAIVRASNVSDKSELADSLAQAEGQSNPAEDAQVALIQAQSIKAKNEAVAKAIEAQYSAIQTAQAIVVTPQAAAMADALLRSGGFQDQDAAPIVPEAQAWMSPPPAGEGAIPVNTHPLTPANPEVGMTAGLSDGPTKPPQ